MIVLEALNLKKTYLKHLPFYKQMLLPLANRQRIKALDSVSIYIESGQILGVVGPNGAGKTTLLRILADILEQDAGTVSICNLRLGTKGYQMRSRIGYVSSDERTFFWRLTGKENLEFFARLYNFSASQAKKRTAQLIRQFGFDDKADQLFRDYSSGMRKKVSVMRALLHNPSLLLLDEVTNSLDPNSAKIVKEMVRQYVSEHKNCAAVWSTHRLEEISQICDKVVMIDSGRIISGGLTEDFMTSSDYMLKLENLNGQIEAFCEKAGCRKKIHSVGDNMNELIISGINQKQFSRIVSIAVKEFGAYVIFAGCIKKDPDVMFEEFQSGEGIDGSCC
ncbi:MAG: ABC transporter ATP-binding protein [Planctomycetota bacterium]|jgi:ABC-2 type transport system ATP-binding protein